MASVPAFKYEKRYTISGAAVQRRDTATIIRDWLNSQQMTETLSKDHQVGIWSLKGRPMIELRFADDGAIKLTMTEHIHSPAMVFTDLDDLPAEIILKSGRDLHRITPVIRLGLDKPVSRYLADCVLVYKRVDECHRTRVLLGQPEPCDGVFRSWHTGAPSNAGGEVHA